MRIDRSFNWLGRFPLGVDLADTVRAVGFQEIELLVDEESLTAWVAAEVPRFPAAEGALGPGAPPHRLNPLARRHLQLPRSIPIEEHETDMPDEQSNSVNLDQVAATMAAESPDTTALGCVSSHRVAYCTRNVIDPTPSGVRHGLLL